MCRKEKKKKTKATKINLSLNDDSDDSDDDSDYDPDNDAVDLAAELKDLFGGDETRAKEAADGLSAGGNVAKHWKRLIKGLRGLENAARDMNIDDDGLDV